jgi:hypothetical protein
MQEPHLYEYAVLRVVPRVERAEFLNIGVILYCGSLSFLQARFAPNFNKVQLLYPDFDLNILEQYKVAVHAMCKGKKLGGYIGLQATSYRFRWLTANRSTIIQASPVHPGRCTDPEATLQHLLEHLVL